MIARSSSQVYTVWKTHFYHGLDGMESVLHASLDQQMQSIKLAQNILPTVA